MTAAAAGRPPRVRGDRVERALFAVFVPLYLAPLWAVARVPTTDGPSHLYNAWLLGQLAWGDPPPLLAAVYDLRLEPLPNWLGHAALALLMTLATPAVAEKLLLSGCLVLFLVALRALAGAVEPDARVWAWLGFPLAYNWLFQMGFTNFCLGLGLALLAVAVWWRRRERPGLGTALLLNALLLLGYFAHVLTLLLALAAIGVLWLATLRRASWRRHLRHLAALAPQLLLPLWFVAARGTAATADGWSGEDLWGYLLRLEVLYTWSPGQLRFGQALAGLWGALAVATLLRENVDWPARRLRVRPADAFLLLALLAVVLYAAAPAGLSGGTLVKQRLSLLPYLLLLPWFSPRLLQRRLAPLGAAALALLAAATLVHQLRWHRRLDGEMRAFLRPLAAVPAHSRLVPLLFARDGSAARVPVFHHAVDYVAVEKGLVDWGNYEAASDLFPVRFAPGLARPEVWTLEARPRAYRVGLHRDHVEAVYAWRLPPGTLVASRLRRHYDLVREDGPGRLYLRKGLARPQGVR
ncbi:MAG TPA: hypothetical protein VF121_00595 [Thermoanaerobaculia bacterium]|nr:hypothetical protein [Thermoanaerobaculia bacterium]